MTEHKEPRVFPVIRDADGKCRLKNLEDGKELDKLEEASRREYGKKMEYLRGLSEEKLLAMYAKWKGIIEKKREEYQDHVDNLSEDQGRGVRYIGDGEGENYEIGCLEDILKEKGIEYDRLSAPPA